MHTLIRHWSIALLLLAVTGSAQAVSEVRIGVLAKRGVERASQQWEPTAQYLTEHLPEYRFSVVPLDFDEIRPAIAEHRIDFVLANSAFYSELEHEYGASRIVTLRNRNGAGSYYTEFGGVIFRRTQEDMPPRLAELKGMRFAAVEQDSLGGFQAAWRELNAAGVDPWHDFSQLRFLGTHDAVVHAVLSGAADVGTVRTDTLERMADEGALELAQIQIINPIQHPGFTYLCSTRLYPEWPLARLSHTSDEISHAVAHTLMEMRIDSPAARAALLAGWTVPRNYQPVDELMRELKIGQYADLGKISAIDVLRQYWDWLLFAIVVVILLLATNTYAATMNRRLINAQGELREARDNLADRVQERTLELEQAMKGLAESNRRLELISRDWNDAFDAIQDPIFIHDGDMRIVHANPAYCSYAGMEQEKLIGRAYFEVFPRLDKPLRHCNEFSEKISSEGDEIQLPNGDVFISRSFAIKHADVDVRHAIHILENVTAERRAELRRRTLSRALEQSAEGVLILNADRTVAYCNPALADMMGHVQGGSELCSLQALMPGSNPVQSDAIFARVETDGSWSGEININSFSGVQHPVYLSVSAIHDELQAPVGYVVTVIDLSELRHAKLALEASEEKYQQLYETAPTAYLSIKAADGSLLQFNQALVDMLGYEREQLRQMTVFQLYADTPDGVAKCHQIFEQFQRGSRVRDVELEMQHSDGHPVWVNLSVDPVFDGEGNVIESRSSLVDITHSKRIEEWRLQMAERLQSTLLQTIQAIALTVEKRDPYTAGHMRRVADLAIAISRGMGLDADRVIGIEMGSLIHDIGKIYIPAEILNRPGQLSDVEFALIKSHTHVGYEIVKDIAFPWPVADMVHQHHERYDGSGYPQGLKGEEIVQEARILAVADVVEAMASHRPYRPSLPLEAALHEIETKAGVYYDPDVVQVCLDLFRSGRFSWS